MMAVMSAMLAGCGTGQQEPFKLEVKERPLVTEEVAKQVDELYDRMSMEEKVAQLSGVFIQDLQAADGSLDTAKCRQLIPNGVGHLDQFASTSKLTPDSLRDLVADLQNWIMQNTPNGIPVLCHDEIIDGADTYGATTYPQSIGLACTFNPDLAEIKAGYSGKNMWDIGGFICFGPMVDVDRNPWFNRDEESYGEDGYLSARMGVAMVRGLEGAGVHACTKHFLGYGGGAENTDKEIFEEILLPHETAIRVGGSKAVMSCYHEFKGRSAVANKEMLTGILRDYVGFDGMTVSDYGSVSQITHTTDPLQRAADAISAGNDVELHSPENYAHLPEALQKGLVSEESLERAVKDVLRFKASLGMLDKNPKLYAEGHIEFDTPKERQMAYDLAAQSIVMLKNNGVLPINKPVKIALVGPNANTIWGLLGDYTYEAMTYFWRFNTPDATYPKLVNPKEGLEAKLPEGCALVYERGCEWVDKPVTVIAESGDERAQWVNSFISRLVPGDTVANWNNAIEQARVSDVIIAAMGENTLLCGENRDRGGIRLPGKQEQFVRELIATGKPVVLVMFGGRAQVIGDLADKCAAVLQAWYPGEEGGNALADIIYGNISPSAKLSVSYPKVELSENICYNYSTKQDERIQWPFGYGLTYTSFEYSNLKADKQVSTDAYDIRLSLDVKNTGKQEAAEIVQLYLSPLDGQPLKPIQLQGFKRVNLKPGEQSTVSFRLSPQQFGYYENGHWNIAAGKYQLKVAASSQDIRLTADIELTGSKLEMPLRTVYFAE